MDLRALAEPLQAQLNAIRRRLRRPLETEFAGGGLTGPQQLVMSALVQTDVGLSLKQLSAKVSLAHSTVSGIVDRLEKKGMVERCPHASDRRVTRIIASKEVREFMKTQVPELTLSPLLEALRLASPHERRAIGKGINVLARLIEPQE